MITPDGREVDDSVVLALAQKGNLLDKLWEDPALRPVVAAVVKQKFPNVPIPEFDLEQKLQATYVKPLQDELTKLRDEQAADKAERAARAEREAVVRMGTIADEDVEEVVKLQNEKGIANFQTAAEHLALQRRAAPPRATQRGVDTSDYKKFFKDPTGTAREEAHKVISEFRR